MTSQAGLSREATVRCEKARDAVQRFVEVECVKCGKAAVHAVIAKLERRLRDVEAKLRSKPTMTAPASKAEPMTNEGTVQPSGRGACSRASRCHAWAGCRVKRSRPMRSTHEA